MTTREVVADASVVVEALTGGSHAAAAALLGRTIHAPHLIDLEVVSALRRLVLIDAVEAATARLACAHLVALVDRRYGHELFLGRIWALRENLRPYDAAYVALAEMLAIPLLTTDARLAAAPGIECEIELLP